jgi:Fe2+ or Zn2+ uptake regulation protein
MLDRRCAEFEARSRARGLRLTPQRLAVYRALAADDSHPTAETVYARVRTELQTLSQATVYRILESLERERFVRRVSTTGGVARFDATLEPHQHLVCRICGRMVDHFAPGLASAPIVVDEVPGFVVEELDVRLVGRCAGCTDTGTPRDARTISGETAARRAASPAVRSSKTDPSRIRRRN